MSLVTVTDLVKTFGRGANAVRGVDSVSFSVQAGEIFGVVGESGSGKSTLARMLLRLETPTSGQAVIDGIDVTSADRTQRAHLRSIVQPVFQDPTSSLNGRMRIRAILREGIVRGPRAHDVDAEARRLLELVGLSAKLIDAFPHEISGGQRQRVAIARALSVDPRLLIADEPVSALDVSMRGQVLNLLAELRRDLGLTCIFIGHDLGVVQQLCDSLIVMSHGRVVERGNPAEVLRNPQHAYTRTLVDSIPRLPS